MTMAKNAMKQHTENTLKKLNENNNKNCPQCRFKQQRSN